MDKLQDLLEKIEEVIEQDLQKQHISDLFKGGKKANIGETRTWDGKDYIKTQDGWDYVAQGHEPKTNEQPKQPPEVQKPVSDIKTPHEVKSPEPQVSKPQEETEQTKEVVESPRQEISETSEEKQEEYVNARKSKVSNLGKDIKGSARHKRQYSSIKDMGTAEISDITVKNLLKQFPINLIDDVAKDNPIIPYVANQILNRFPASPKHEVQKEMYLETFEYVRNRVQELSKQKDLLFTDVISAIQKEIVAKIKENRASENYVRGSDDFLVPYVNKTLNFRKTKGSVGQDVEDLVNAFARTLPESDQDGLSVGYMLKETRQAAMAEFYTEEGVRKIKDLVEGKSLSKVFEIVSEGKKSKKFSVAEIYTQDAKRTGPDTKLTTEEDQANFIIKSCEMKGLQWGNSVTDEERKHHLKMSSEAFKDLADILDLPEKMISFNGRLGLAIGARGHGTALAHYEPKEIAINLTRSKGVGSLAHEWGHFLDNILSKTHGVNAHPENQFLSESAVWNMGDKSPVQESMKELVKSDAWKSFKDSTRDALNDLAKHGIKEKPSYWMSPKELFARAFEGYISYKLKSKDRENTYLSGGSEGLMWCTKEQKEKLAPYFDKFFEELKKSDHIKKAMDLENDLQKGSLQSKMGNPKKQLRPQETNTMINWVSEQQPRENIPEATNKAKQRFFHKLHSQTEVKKHPKTGERMFLMHRGTETDSDTHNTSLSSWTPNYNIANDFADSIDDDGTKSTVHSAWIPESAIHNYIPNSIDRDIKEYDELIPREQEYIVKPHNFLHANWQKLPNKEGLDRKINWKQRIYGKGGRLAAGENIENDLTKSKINADEEGEIIKKNKEKAEAKRKHKFKAAQWTHPNGHPRCIICGDEERIDGYCSPSLDKSQTKWHKRNGILQKSWRKAIATGAALSTMLVGAHNMGQNKEPGRQPSSVDQSQINQVKIAPDHGLKSDMLHNIKNNPIVENNVLPKGRFGQYSLSQNAIKSVFNKNQTLGERYGHLLKLSPNELDQQLKNDPNLDHQLADSHWHNLQSEFGNKPDHIAHAWYQNPENTRQESQLKGGDSNFNNHFYVSKIIKNLKK